MPMSRFVTIRGVEGRLMMDPWSSTRRPLGQQRILDPKRLEAAVHWADRFEPIEQVVPLTIDVQRAIDRGDLEEVNPGVRVIAKDRGQATEMMPKAIEAFKKAEADAKKREAEAKKSSKPTPTDNA